MTSLDWYNKGVELSKISAKHKEAEDAYRRAIELDENYAYVWHGLGNLLSDYPTRHKEAECAYRRAIELDEKDAFPWSGVGTLLSKYPSRHKEAEDAYYRAIKIDEKDAFPWYGLGNHFSKNPTWHQEAEDAYRRAIELDENYAHPWSEIGNLLSKYSPRHQEAEDAYRRAIELDGKFAHPWIGLGILLSDYPPRHQEAEDAYWRAIKLDRNHASPWNGLGNLLSDYPSRHQEAEDAYRRAIELDGKFVFPWHGLGNLLSNDPDRHQEAEDAYHRAIELDNNFAYPWHGLGNLLSINSRRHKEAEDAYYRAIELDDNFAHPWIGLIILETSSNKKNGKVDVGKVQKVISIASANNKNIKALASKTEFLFDIVRISNNPLLLLRLHKEFNSNGINYMPDSHNPDLSIQELVFFAESNRNVILKATIYLYGGDAETCFQILDTNESGEDLYNYQFQYYLYRSATQYYNNSEAESVLNGIFKGFKIDFGNELQVYYAALIHLEYFNIYEDLTKIDSAIKLIESLDDYEFKPHITLLYLILLLNKNPEDSVAWDKVRNFFIEESQTKIFEDYLSPIKLEGENYTRYLHAKELSSHLYKLQNLSKLNQYAEYQGHEDLKLAKLFDIIELRSPFQVWKISTVEKDLLSIKKKVTKESWQEKIQSRIKDDPNIFSLLKIEDKEELPGLIASKMEVLVKSNQKLNKFLDLIDYFKLKDYYTEKVRNLLCIYARICLRRNLVFDMNEAVIKSIICKVSQFCIPVPDFLGYIGFFDDTWNVPMSEKVYNYLRKRFEDKTIAQLTYYELKNEIDSE